MTDREDQVSLFSGMAPVNQHPQTKQFLSGTEDFVLHLVADVLIISDGIKTHQARSLQKQSQ
eukprot:3958245-Amphidinium_carterae.1